MHESINPTVSGWVPATCGAVGRVPLITSSLRLQALPSGSVQLYWVFQEHPQSSNGITIGQCCVDKNVLHLHCTVQQPRAT